MARLTGRVERLFEGEREQARQDVQRILATMLKVDKLLMMTGFEAEFRGEPEPEGFAEVMARFGNLGGMEALRRLELLGTDADRAEAAERRQRMTAGEDWREIHL